MELRGRQLCAALALALALGSATVGCGGTQDDAADSPPPLAGPADFPKLGKGATLADLRKRVGVEGPVLSPSVSELSPGRNRFGFGLFDRARAQIADAPLALYVARAGGGPARGPFPARFESLAVKPQFESRSVASDPDAAKSLYVARIDFPGPGRYEVVGVARLDDRLVAATAAGPALTVKAKSPVPQVGERAPRTSTPTEADVGGDLARIDTREPPSTMHDVDFAKVVGRRPAILVFATPALCSSRVCGPVVDIAEQVKARRGDDAAFVHMEIYRDNEIDQGFRPQVLDWRLPTEPWVFAVDRRGRIAARLEGAFSDEELERAVDAAVGKG
ncbi:MAG: hypothetical protein ACR2GL_07385 [Thermoleophilaceae bacterium]